MRLSRTLRNWRGERDAETVSETVVRTYEYEATLKTPGGADDDDDDRAVNDRRFSASKSSPLDSVAAASLPEAAHDSRDRRVSLLVDAFEQLALDSEASEQAAASEAPASE